jgi:hypothetical protein
MRTFDEILTQVTELLQRDGRVAYRVLKRRFDIDDEYVEDLKADLIDAKRLAIDENGKVLVWIGTDSDGETANRRPSLNPIAYTPVHLAERIRAEQAAIEARGARTESARRSQRYLLISKGRRP